MATSRSNHPGAGTVQEPRRLLIANRGEIALRIMRGARDEGWTTVAIYSEADRSALHAVLADEAHPVGPAPSAESYLNVSNILSAARKGRATHVHPGYGFLSENADFAEACLRAGFGWIGPPPVSIRAMGDKVAARNAAREAGVPLIPGTPGLAHDPEETVAWAEEIGFPVLIKAAFGGGGKGMRLCRDARELLTALELTRGEASRAFGSDLLYLEKAILRPRHIEIQVLCDAQGAGVHLGERECSIQRRHQKLIEESPSTAITAEQRARMGEAAVRLALRIGYQNAGTVEFLLSPEGEFYFLEMNTRLQVEHPVTEMVTGIDLVRAQLRLALGQPLAWRQEEIRPHGWSMECRICAEDSEKGFLPSSGRVLRARLPEGPGVRNDVGIETGSEVPVHYDPMLGKLITYGRDREEARLRMLRALDEYVIEGVHTNLNFHRFALRQPAFIEGALDTGFVEQFFNPNTLRTEEEDEILAQIAAVAAYRDRERPSGVARATATAGSVSTGSATAGRWAPRISPWKRGMRFTQ
jgi:acetyl-CoA carboxylase, biotin carboxylase subunit